MMQLYNTLLYQPMLNLLVFFYNLIPDIGVGIIILTIIIRLILLPLTAKMYKSQKAMQALQPQMKELQEKYKKNPQELSKAMMQLYQKEKVNPLSSCLPVLLQLPFLIALYQVLVAGLDATKTLPPLYSFISNPEHLSPYFLSVIDLSVKSLPLAVLAGIAQYFQTKMMPMQAAPRGIPGSKDENMMAGMNRQMLYIMPVFTVFIGASMPAGLTFYWLITTLFSIAQQWYFLRGKAPTPQDGST